MFWGWGLLSGFRASEISASELEPEDLGSVTYHLCGPGQDLWSGSFTDQTETKILLNLSGGELV